MAELSDKHLQYKEEIARTILSVADKVLPGELKGPLDPELGLGTLGRQPHHIPKIIRKDKIKIKRDQAEIADLLMA